MAFIRKYLPNYSLRILMIAREGPELDCAGMDVASGTDAMEAWQRLIGLPAGQAKDDLQKSMLEYCGLDTLAMVRIFEVMEEL